MNAEQVAHAARAVNAKASVAVADAEEYRGRRDRLMRQLNRDYGWSYGQIAKAVGVSRGLVAQICRPGRA